MKYVFGIVLLAALSQLNFAFSAASSTSVFDSTPKTEISVVMNEQNAAARLFAALRVPPLEISRNDGILVEKKLTLESGLLEFSCQSRSTSAEASPAITCKFTAASQEDRPTPYTLIKADGKAIVEVRGSYALVLYHQLDSHVAPPYINEMKEYSKRLVLRIAERGQLEVRCHVDATQDNDRCLITASGLY